jgi:hypothetical protein
MDSGRAGFWEARSRDEKAGPGWAGGEGDRIFPFVQNNEWGDAERRLPEAVIHRCVQKWKNWRIASFFFWF